MHFVYIFAFLIITLLIHFTGINEDSFYCDGPQQQPQDNVSDDSGNPQSAIVRLTSPAPMGNSNGGNTPIVAPDGPHSNPQPTPAAKPKPNRVSRRQASMQPPTTDVANLKTTAIAGTQRVTRARAAGT